MISGAGGQNLMKTIMMNIKKVLKYLRCLFGLHEWKFYYHLRADSSIFTHEHFLYKCKHCGKIKEW